eukprot:CAMPEP_0116895388 /NCGR_PEP_ID=MMETSP0467-20121206/4921_1 /TAXON_ID=283647 /ORGANISM="Mesodinium pulex, Strain SPMC105" /LENGTH=135 /DNA_ID=CAMNT_0004566087 /DNA_START=1134 /DNA_END=1543 /DNA_ORIENTATION=-
MKRKKCETIIIISCRRMDPAMQDDEQQDSTGQTADEAPNEDKRECGGEVEEESAEPESESDQVEFQFQFRSAAATSANVRDSNAHSDDRNQDKTRESNLEPDKKSLGMGIKKTQPSTSSISKNALLNNYGVYRNP